MASLRTNGEVDEEVFASYLDAILAADEGEAEAELKDWNLPQLTDFEREWV